MAALLVALAVMAVLMSAAMPVWKHQAQREKETELVWRLQQYAIAIQLWRNRFQTFPPNIDVLVQQRFLRKKFKDPITGKDFEPIPAAQQQPGAPGQSQGAIGAAGILGVRSTSKENSIRVFKGATNYQQFDSMKASPQWGMAPQGGQPGDGRGGPGAQRPGMPGRGGPGGMQPGGGRGPGGIQIPGGRGPGPSPFPQPGGGRGPSGRGRGF